MQLGLLWSSQICFLQKKKSSNSIITAQLPCVDISLSKINQNPKSKSNKSKNCYPIPINSAFFFFARRIFDYCDTQILVKKKK